MKIGIDYDHTISADRELFMAFVKLAKKRGHEVAIVTARQEASAIYGHYSNTDIESDAAAMDVPIIYTAGEQKSKFFKADVVIDDCPEVWPSRECLKAVFDWEDA